MEAEERAIPRNGSGTYAVPTSFTTGTTISSADVNGNFSDMGAEITNSLARDGQSGMTGQFKASNGTASAPSMTFGADSDTGYFRKDANTIGVAAGGAEVGSIGPAGFATAAGDPMTAFPSGTAMLFVQTAAPTGWTKSVTHDNKALRVVSGTASSGGTTAFTSVFGARTISQANLPNVNLSSGSLSASSSTSVSVSNGGNRVTNGGSGVSAGTGGATWSSGNVTATATTTTTISGTVPLGGSGMAVDFAVQYVDGVICIKD